HKKLARAFQHACKSGEPAAVRAWAARWAEALARLQVRAVTPEVQREIGWDVERVERQWRDIQKSKEQASHCTLAGAQFFIARCHGFASWPKFAEHLDALARANSPGSHFESAEEALPNRDIV